MDNSSLLKRVDIACSLDELLNQACRACNIGSLRSYEFLSDGYQELNIKTTTTQGDFVIKIFSKEKSLKRIQDNIWGYLSFRKQGVPFPVLRKTDRNEYAFSIPGKKKTSYLCVMEYFDGQYLRPQKATDDDLLRLTDYMATIHKNTHRIGRYYDTMGIANLLSQFKKFHRYLTDSHEQRVSQVVREYQSLPHNRFRRCIIHGTLESENILKRDDNLCLLDLGCMDYNAAIYDVATFLANYTLDIPHGEKQRRIDLVVNHYQLTLPLVSYERDALVPLIHAQYAIIYLRTNYYVTKLRDTSKLTINWLEKAKRGLA
ncbi:phosphotransferase [Candidatus Gottesmanbacteria bacterium]|nr:phosphotransferase [Candidatus Gottesmanbacteria bacterium]